jgi:hypothetical protein
MLEARETLVSVRLVIIYEGEETRFYATTQVSMKDGDIWRYYETR